jgi:hypothetical protein
MNFVYLSPHFPTNYPPFIEKLRQNGVNVLGIGDVSYDSLPEMAKRNLVEYYRVSDLHRYDELVRAMGYFTHRFGKLDRVESHNEYWLETEARLRTDFNLDGPKTDEIRWVKQKSRMKQIYVKAGVPVAKGRVIKNMRDAQKLVNEVGYPLIAKPDIGVGAANTFKISNDLDLNHFFETPPTVEYIFEEFVIGEIFSFDGLTNQDGEVVFFTAHFFSQGIMETVSDDTHIFYYSLREIPEEIITVGMKTVQAFNIRARFFHLEFFKTQDGRIVALEVNMRPPGGLTTDMYNYANDFDIYQEYANMIAYNQFNAHYERPYHCAYISRKNRYQYVMQHQQILEKYGHLIVQHDPISPIIRDALGDYGYVIRSPHLEEIYEVIDEIQKSR